MIILVIGPPGTGKSRKATMLVHAKYLGGQRVISNIKLNFAYTPLRDVDLSVEPELTNTVLYLDEIHTITDSRRSGKGSNIEWSYLFLQTRKMRVDVVATSQFIGQVDVRFRDIVDIVIMAKATAWENVNGERRATAFEYVALNPSGGTIRWPEQRGDEVLLYNTHEVVRTKQDSFTGPLEPAAVPKKVAKAAKPKSRGKQLDRAFGDE